MIENDVMSWIFRKKLINISIYTLYSTYTYVFETSFQEQADESIKWQWITNSRSNIFIEITNNLLSHSAFSILYNSNFVFELRRKFSTADKLNDICMYIVS